MRAMILAAGRGERMRPLTERVPKPLLPVAGRPIIERIIERLVASGFAELVVNHAYLGAQIEAALGDGGRFNAVIRYSAEGGEPLETAGGIIQALPLLGADPFLVVNGDIATDFPFADLKRQPVDLVHLVLVDNPPHHPQGDFGLEANGAVTARDAFAFTYSGIGVYHPELFKALAPGKRKLLPLLEKAVAAGRASGQYYPGYWLDIGTPERLQELQDYYYRQGNDNVRSHL